MSFRNLIRKAQKEKLEASVPSTEHVPDQSQRSKAGCEDMGSEIDRVLYQRKLLQNEKLGTQRSKAIRGKGRRCEKGQGSKRLPAREDSADSRDYILVNFLLIGPAFDLQVNDGPGVRQLHLIRSVEEGPKGSQAWRVGEGGDRTAGDEMWLQGKASHAGEDTPT